MRPASLDIKQTIRGSVPRIQFEEIARAVLGPQYELSVVVCGDCLARRINRETRKKTYAPNVLSFPLEKNSGEIFLNLRKAEREARAIGVSTRERFALLFVHGLYHLKGLDHENESATKKMEALEMKTLRRFCLAGK